jgi:hypothetical protein
MYDYFSEHYEWDGNVPRRKKKRVAADGERISFPMTMMDHRAYGFSPSFADGTPDYTDPHRPGYRLSDSDDPHRLAAEEAYATRNRRMASAWRDSKGDPQIASHDPQQHSNGAPRTRTLDQLQRAADEAYEQRRIRMSNRWRNRA